MRTAPTVLTAFLVSAMATSAAAVERRAAVAVECFLSIHAGDYERPRTFTGVDEQVFRALVRYAWGTGSAILPADPADAIELVVTDTSGAAVPLDISHTRITFATAAGYEPTAAAARTMNPDEAVEFMLRAKPQGREHFEPGQYQVACRLAVNKVRLEPGVELRPLPDVPKDFEVVQVGGPDDLKSLYQIRASQAVERKDFAAAISWYVEASREVPDDDLWGPYLASTYLRAGDDDSALEWFAKCKQRVVAMRLKSGRAGLLDRVALVYAERGDRVEALRVLELALPPAEARRALDAAKGRWVR